MEKDTERVTQINLKDLLLKKAEFPVRLIALEDEELNEYKWKPNYLKNDELGIEAIDFSCGNIRVCNKTKNSVFYIYYDKDTWELGGKFKFKKD